MEFYCSIYLLSFGQYRAAYKWASVGNRCVRGWPVSVHDRAATSLQIHWSQKQTIPESVAPRCQISDEFLVWAVISNSSSSSSDTPGDPLVLASPLPSYQTQHTLTNLATAFINGTSNWQQTFSQTFFFVAITLSKIERLHYNKENPLKSEYGILAVGYPLIFSFITIGKRYIFFGFFLFWTQSHQTLVSIFNSFITVEDLIDLILIQII